MRQVRSMPSHARGADRLTGEETDGLADDYTAPSRQRWQRIEQAEAPHAVVTVARSWPSITLALGGEGPPRRTESKRGGATEVLGYPVAVCG